MTRKLVALCALALVVLCGCREEKGLPKPVAADVRPPGELIAGDPYPGDEVRSSPKIDAQRAMKYVREVVAIGARPIGSPAHKKLEDYILAQLKGDQVEIDEFTAQTPAGSLPMRNIIAKYPGTKDGIIVIGSHYDTLYGRPKFVGANDGGATTGLLL